MEMAKEYELVSFVNNHRVEQITTSIMNEFEFLKPENKDDAFEIEPLSWNLIWRKMWTKELTRYICTKLHFHHNFVNI